MNIRITPSFPVKFPPPLPFLISGCSADIRLIYSIVGLRSPFSKLDTIINDGAQLASLLLVTAPAPTSTVCRHVSRDNCTFCGL